ncbi:MAG: hypothetical protein ACHQ4H_14640 [Ktedonobacterales bacterium]
MAPVGLGLLDLTAPRATLPRTILASTFVNPAGLATWAPDGAHLAVVTTLPSGCAIAIYTVSGGYPSVSASFDLTAELQLPQFARSGPQSIRCFASTLTWSADANWLAFVPMPGIRVPSVLALRPLWPQILAGTRSHPTMISVPSDAMQSLDTQSNGAVAWIHSSTALTFVTARGRTIQNVEVTSLHAVTLLSENVAEISFLSWTPDGQYLVFDLNVPMVPEYVSPPADLYVLTVRPT